MRNGNRSNFFEAINSVCMDPQSNRHPVMDKQCWFFSKHAKMIGSGLEVSDEQVQNELKEILPNFSG
jgi:hypothetical protein